MTNVGSWFVDVVPSFKGVSAKMQAETVPAAAEAGGKSGKSFSDAFAASTKSGAANASAALESSVKRAEAAVTSASQRIIAARAGEKAAAEKVSLAEQQLAEVRAKFGTSSSQIVAAEERLNAARSSEALTAGKVKLAEQQLSEVRSKFSGGSSQVIAAEERLNVARANGESAAGKVRVADQQLSEVRSKFSSGSSEIVAAEQNLAAAQRGTTTAAAAGETAQAKLNAAKAKLSEVSNTESVALTRTKSIMSDTSPVVGGLISQYGKLGAAVGISVVLGLGIHAVKAAGDFQSSQERLVTTAGELQSNLKSVGDGVLTMAGQVGYSAQSLSTGLYTVESAGYHGAQALKVMQAAAEGAKTENADLTTVTDAVTSAMQDYHFGADQAATVTSKMVTAVGDGKTTFEQLTGAMSAILPKAASAHVGLDEILGDLSAMTLHGVSAEQASQNLADALSHLANPTLAQTKELAALGLSAADLSKNLGKTGVSGAMLEIEQAVLQHMGPAGTTLLNSFNQSKQAAADAKTMFDSLPPAAHKVAQAVLDGSLSFKEFRKSGGGLAVDQKALVDQWFSVQKSASGFSDVLKTGGNATQTFSQAMAKATGDSASLNVALMLTGENAATVQKNIRDVAGASAEAGGHVKGWSEVQGTFNQKLDEVKASMGAWFIQIGTALLPALTSFLGFLQQIPALFSDIVHWVDSNKFSLIALGVALGILNAQWIASRVAMAAWTVVTTAASVATKVWTVTTAALDAVLDANPIVLVVAAIALLVAGVIYAWTHFAGFRDVVITVWHAVEAAGKAIWTALVTAFHAVADVVVAVGKAIWTALVTAFHAVADAAVWLWQTILKPVFDFISLAVRILIAIIVTVFVAPLVILFRSVIAPTFTWLWNSVIKPIFGFIGDIFSWIYNNIIKPIIGFIKIEIKAWGDIFTWIWNSVIKPTFKLIGDIFGWIYNNIIKPVIAAIKFEIKALGDLFTWIWNSVIKPIFKLIGDIFGWIYNNIIKPIVAGIKIEIKAWGDIFTWIWHNIIQPVFKGIGDAISWTWNNVIKPVFEAIKTAVGKVGDAFSAAKDFIGKVWDGIKDVVSKPIHWVVDVVYTHGIKAVWDKVADFVHLGHLPDAPAFSGGGVMPGYAPGQDTQLAWLSPGEGILVPEAVKMLGPSTIHAINAAASGRPAGGGTHFAGGGIFGAIGNWFSSTVSDIGTFLKDPIGNIGKALHGVIDGIAGGQDSPIAKMVFQIPGQAIDGLINMVKSWFSSGGGGGSAIGGSAPSNPTGNIALGQAMAAAMGWTGGQWNALYNLWQGESGWSSSIANGSSGAYGIPQSLPGSKMASAGADWRTNPGTQIRWGLGYIAGRYGSPASAYGQWLGRHPHWYDDGGWLQPGVSATVNATGRPEAVLTEGQWSTVRTALSRQIGGGDRVYNVTSHDPSSVIAEIQRLEHIEMVTTT